ncbi:MmcQ/YjbR family DNA-binding protein [Gilvimarinus sp. 1_MG-2023]|uniref:MmcQ/YjbR family DNA-binding protein n=1 Tax=Gilvimarinus sp. 1_MG-2023 TaxID=3062638 RepID=UPI0026E41820|nr:MmcQ/YjbR family DNA-binding protein [Gilvimarinus sp. 1_MG-2023]MDO6747583.1 MmcQ/YjbR family DNA-binding protein [Gilvimarinus sp. 1_MG-2023]
MDYQAFNDLCASLPATSHVVQWGNSDVWKVGGKVFAVGGWQKNNQPAFTFKTSDYHFDLLSQEPGYRPAPYLASRGFKWIQQYDAGPAQDDALTYYLTESHRIVAAGLSKKRQRELGLL